VSETITTGSVPETVTTSISRRDTLQQIDGCGAPDDAAADGRRSRFRCRRSGTPTLERWGQPQPDIGMTPRPRRAGALSLTRWRTRTKPTSVHPTLVVEALPSGAPLPPNAKNLAASLTSDAFAEAAASTLLH
jgi:hypothetical protein